MQKTRQTVQRDTGRTVGHLYARLDAAREQRAQALAPLEAANDDHRTPQETREAWRVFPTLKPAQQETTFARTVRRWDWVVPWLIGALIAVLIVRFAVS